MKIGPSLHLPGTYPSADVREKINEVTIDIIQSKLNSSMCLYNPPPPPPPNQ